MHFPISVRICVVILSLTIWVASGQSVFDHARAAARGADSFLTDLKQGVSFLSHGIDAVESIVKESKDTHCRFACPYGSSPKKVPGYKPHPNGCGSYGVQLSPENLPHKHMNKCCNKHDICYGTCQAKKEKCDADFMQCLDEVCNKKKSNSVEDALACKAVTVVFHAGSQYLGCKAFKDAQNAACRCHRKDEL